MVEYLKSHGISDSYYDIVFCSMMIMVVQSYNPNHLAMDFKFKVMVSYWLYYGVYIYLNSFYVFS
ncbi:hypothetical protein [Clostridium tunisiense]|uniref:hypothetical protein n=1 Tax=Clostridium tunisiense TaxID=219748 RepID=UPI00178C7768|nr:hypothetical protein [Clostridium tunisiense]